MKVVTWSKGHVLEPPTQSQKLAQFGVNTFSAGGDMYFAYHVTPQDHFIEVPYIFMGESSLQQVTALKSSVFW